MAKRIKQVRYYEDGSSKNSDANIKYQQLVSGSAFTAYTPITQLGIQALPGTKFSLNNSQDSIIIGSTGIYELDLTDGSEVVAISFDPLSIQAIRTNANAYLIVDMIYDDGEV